MAKSTAKKKAFIQLPVQLLGVRSLAGKKFKDIIFQFDVNTSKSGTREYKLVGYIFDLDTRQWVKINLPVVRTLKRVSIKLPITLGNLVLKNSEFRSFSLDKTKNLTLTPVVYKSNPHASVEVSDGRTSKSAKPCPPYCSY